MIGKIRYYCTCIIIKNQPVYRQPYYMSRRMRLMIMGVLIASFFIISPIIILFTAGYRYDMVEGNITGTGVLSIDVSPGDARVFIDNVLIENKIPIHEKNLIPNKNYIVRIEKEGYRTWNKEIFVRPNQTAYISDIALYKNEIPEYISLPSTTQSVLNLSPNGTYIFTIDRDSGYDHIFIYDTKIKKRTSVAYLPVETALQVSWSSTGDFAVIEYSLPTQSSLILVDPVNPLRTWQYTTKDAKKIDWQWVGMPDVPTLAVRNDEIISILKQEDELKIGQTSSTVWFVDDQYRLWQMNSADNTLERISEDTVVNSMAVPPGITRVVDMHDGYTILQRGQDTTVIYDQNNSARLTASSFIFDKKNSLWTAWSPFEVWHIDKKGGTLLNRTGEKIQAIRILRENGELLLATENKLIAFNPSYFHSIDLSTFDIISDVGVNKKDRDILILGQFDGRQGLWRLEY